jgi:hypothetical protein
MEPKKNMPQSGVRPSSITIFTRQSLRIAENLYSQVDNEGYETLFLVSILEHKKDNSSVSKDDQYTRSCNGNMVIQITTKGWNLLVQWKDGSTSWEPLQNLKESNPVEVAKYAVANKSAEEAAFSWWVKTHTPEQRAYSRQSQK